MRDAPSWDLIKEVFQEALDRPPHERSAWLRERCSDNQELHAEVASLLATHEEVGSFAERPAIELLGQLTTDADSRLLGSVGRMMHPGDRVGIYEIHAFLGAGGMGEVYRARDTHLGRDVAIKVLPAVFVTDRERLARFEREACVLAALNHPNIAAIYGVERIGDGRALVLELADGETLAERIRAHKSGLPLSDALSIAQQVADALETAHEKGIVHRDLKPSNVKITPAGVIKVLDFGLAKYHAREPGRAGRAGGEFPSAQTPTADDTATGVLLGTAAYMSPEQARGQSVDKRTDIWAFGCVLYEMLTGHALFPSKTVSGPIAAILECEPDWAALPATTPIALRRVLRRCLEKDPKRRLHDIADARIELEESGARVSDLGAALERGHTSGRFARHARAAWISASLIVVIAAGLWDMVRSRGPAQPMRHLVMPTNVDIDGFSGGVATSLDGTKVVFAGNAQLYLRAMNEPAEIPIRGTEAGATPFFSPDGQWIGFFVGGGHGKSKLKKISISGGTAVALCDCAPDMRGASWGSDDSIVFASTGASGLSRIPASGGPPTALTALDASQGEESHRFPQVLPGARAVIYTVGTGPGDEARVVGQVLATGQRRVLVPGSASARNAAGYLVYARGGSLYAVSFDPSSLAVSGTPRKIVDGVAEDSDGSPAYSLSDTGDLVYTPGPAGAPTRTLVWVDRTGAIETLPAPPAAYSTPRLSPDGRRIAFHIEAAKNDIWVYDIPRATTTRMMFGRHNSPIWSPDGNRLTFVSSEPPLAGMSWGLADGRGVEERLTTSPNAQWPESWSPDGRTLAFDELDPVNGWDIWTISLDGDRKPRPFLRTPFNEWRPRFSPDGRWLAYHSNESGRYEVYVRPFPGLGAKTQVSTGGGGLPIWRRDGREIFYRNPTGIWAVSINGGSSLSVGLPRKLFAARAASDTATSGFDVTPDGRRVLMVQEDVTPLPRQINVIVNWAQTLKR